MTDELTPQERALYTAVDDHYRAHYCPADPFRLWRISQSRNELIGIANVLVEKGYLLPTARGGLTLIPSWVKSVIDNHFETKSRARFLSLKDRILKKLNLKGE